MINLILLLIQINLKWKGGQFFEYSLEERAEQTASQGD